MPKTIKIELSTASIERAKKEIKEYRRQMKLRLRRGRKKLAKQGKQFLDKQLSYSMYDGEPDYEVYNEIVDSQTSRVTAYGESVIFAEFGTGIRYLSHGSHPYNSKFGTGQGTYSKKGQWDNPSGWTYIGNPGTNGRIIRYNKDGEAVVRTLGNPAQMPVYKTYEMMRLLAPSVYRSVYHK